MPRCFKISPFVLSFALLIPAPAHWAESAEVGKLPTLRIEDSSPTDILNQDALLPIWTEEAGSTEGDGNLQSQLLDDLPLPSTNSGGAGALSQFRGLGQSAEDTQIQAFGVSLNPAQGGGFDFSTFPQFIWSDYQFQLTPAPGALNLQANAGVLTLVPWTQHAVSSLDPSHRISAFASSAGVQQFSAGFASSKKAAVLAGVSTGQSQGPSGSFSGKWSAGSLRGQMHFLGTSLESEVPGPAYARTPRARQTTVRLLPVFQADADLASDVILKTSLFFDSNYIAFDTPETPDRGRNHSRQWGANAAVLAGNWKFGGSIKRATINNSYVFMSGSPSLSRASETIGGLQVAPIFVLGSMQVEPTVQLLSVERYGVSPAAGLGVRRELQARQALYSRLAYSHRYPTLLERYGQYSQYVGNPDLEVEKDWTGILGWEMNESAWEVDLQLYGQIRNDTIPSFGTPSAGSLGRAVVGSFLHTVRHRLSDQFSIREAGALSGSEVSRTQVGFPYLPAYAQSLALEAADRIEDPKWKASLVARAQTRVVAPVVNPATYGTDPVAELPGWAYFDLTGQFELFQGGKGSWIEKLDLFAQLENLFDRGIEFQRDYPGKGRTVSAGVTGQF